MAYALQNPDSCMRFYTYEIVSPCLRPYIQFLLFNQCHDPNYTGAVTYFPNNDICLGIVAEKKLVRTGPQFSLHPSTSYLNSYLSGFYTKPHSLHISGVFD